MGSLRGDYGGTSRADRYEYEASRAAGEPDQLVRARVARRAADRSAGRGRSAGRRTRAAGRSDRPPGQAVRGAVVGDDPVGAAALLARAATATARGPRGSPRTSPAPPVTRRSRSGRGASTKTTRSQRSSQPASSRTAASSTMHGRPPLADQAIDRPGGSGRASPDAGWPPGPAGPRDRRRRSRPGPADRSAASVAIADGGRLQHACAEPLDDPVANRRDPPATRGPRRRRRSPPPRGRPAAAPPSSCRRRSRRSGR